METSLEMKIQDRSSSEKNSKKLNKNGPAGNMNEGVEGEEEEK